MTDFNSLAGLFRMFGDETRIRILTSLQSGEMSAGQIARDLSMTPSAVSHQLSTLKSSKLIKSRREGKSMLYSLDDEHVSEILSCGMQHIAEGK